MVTPLHEGLVKITTLVPEHTAHMLRALFDLPIPESAEAKVVSCDLSECVPVEYRADAALLYGDGAEARLGVIAEVQLQPSKAKRFSWPAYIANLRARDQCPVCLVVICPDRATARWAATPIETGHPGLTLTPLVIGPDNTPVITDVAEAIGNIGLAAVSAITHNYDPQVNAILATLTEALASVDLPIATRYAEYVLVSLRDDAQKEMERLMATQTHLYQGEYARSLKAEGRAEGKTEGKAEGEAEAVLLLLDHRRVPLTEADRARIMSTTDLDVLRKWVLRAPAVESVEELFA
ncbi:hypothetical protein ACWGH8_34270 [Nonomuraea muscovyensis]